MRLRNRIVKSGFWTDGELLRWHRDKRYVYQSLWALAEDSCCVVDDPFEWKLNAWPSPEDADLTVDILTHYRDELVEAGKAIPYRNGKAYLYLPEMAKHEKPRNPQEPDLPLPPWVTFEVTGEGRNKRVVYTHGDCPERPGNRDTTVQISSGYRDTSPVLSCPDQTRPDQSVCDATHTPTFEDAYKVFPVKGYKDKARKAWESKIAEGKDPAELYAACANAPADAKSMSFYLEDDVWEKYVPKAPRGPCTNPACVSGFIETSDGAVRCSECNGGAR